MSILKGSPMIRNPLAAALSIMVTLVVLLSIAGSATAQVRRIGPGGNVSPAPMPVPGPTDPAELEAFLDDLLSQELEENHIAGAAVSVVKDGKLFFAKGYGYADLENKIPVDAEQTIFRIGSVGKVFTWTAVMQLVEQGKLDLDEDINTYLDFRIPDTYPQPITLKHLMTHTSGIEDRWLEGLTPDASKLVSEREWLTDNFPGRVRPPGEAAGYSNYNAMLGGYIVARVSGEPYEQYIQKHIFDTLGMTHSTVQPQMPEDLRPFLSKSYTYIDGAFQPFPDYLPQPAGLPSGMHQASVTDMARFMIARLEGGFYGDASTEMRILEESTAKQILTTLYTPDPRLRGTAYGLFDFSDNGQWTLGHSGYAPVMISLLILLPDQHLGVFVAYNSLGAREGGLDFQHFGFQRAFFDHYYPAPAVAPIQPSADFAERAERFTGLYKTTNNHSTTPEKVARLFGEGTLEIRDAGDGMLAIPMGDGHGLRFVEVEPLYFRQVDGSLSIVFRDDDKGRITHMFTDFIPHYGYVKMNWYETPGFNMMLALVCVLVFLSMLPVALVRFIRGRRSVGDQNPFLRGARVADRIILAISLLNLLFVVGIAIWFRPMHPSELHDIPQIVEMVMGLGVLAAVLTPGALVYTVLAWKNSHWGISYRVYYTLVTIAAVAIVWFLNYWNWLGWRY
jgi:CubicO group peptidase (beta-lactamase class C family)